MESRTELHYTVRYYDEIRKKWVNTNYKMSEATAAAHFAGRQYEILPHTKVERRIDGDPLVNSLSRFYQPKK